MGSFGSLMSFIEGKTLIIERKIDRSKFLNKIKKFRKKNMSFFQDSLDQPIEFSKISSETIPFQDLFIKKKFFS